MTYRLGLDIGANSIGWSCLSLDAAREPIALLDLGVRIFSDGRNPKSGSSLAVERRIPRGMRRRRDRYLTRRGQLLNRLCAFGLMPVDAALRTDIARWDPYPLRQAALHRRLAPFELGRVIFHLHQRRGFKSNRKVDRGNQEAGKIALASAQLTADLARDGALSLGDWLAVRHAKGLPVRVRLAGTGKNAAYAFYPTRALLEDEFDQIWRAQSGWNAALTDDQRAALRRIMFHQRPLRPVLPGKCWLEPDEDRADKALPTTQRFRIAQTIAHLRVDQAGFAPRDLTADERQLLLNLLYQGEDLTQSKIKKLLGLSAIAELNMRDEKILGATTAARLAGAAKPKKPPPIGPAWHEFDLETQDAITQIILDFEELEAPPEGIAALTAYGLSEMQADDALRQTLPDGHGSLSVKAMRRIIKHLEGGLTYDKAVQAAGYAHHSDMRTGEVRTELPYYGELLAQRLGTGTGESAHPIEQRFGKAPNPTVHVALNEVRRVVNAIIARHGAPAEIVVETLRELGQSAKQRAETDKKNRENARENEARKKTILGLDLRVSGENITRLRLLDEQADDPKNRCCPYTGEIITPALALSEKVEIDHILPRALTLDDSMANKILVMRAANRIKGRRAPYDAFAHMPEWPDILTRAALLPKQKSWRFGPDALAKFADEENFLARHLTDSAMIARWAVFYLEVLAPGKVWSVPGRLTGLLRHSLGLNSQTLLGKGGAIKDRTDHLHHAIDAVVVALTSRSMLKRMSDAARRAEGTDGRLVVAMEPPWVGFVAQVADRLQSVVVSHKPDTGVQGALHNDTAYGAVVDASRAGKNVVVRKPVEALAGESADKILDKVRDPQIGRMIAAVASVPSEDGVKPAPEKMFLEALPGLRGPNGMPVRRVRIWERLDVQPIADRRTGVAYKFVKLDGNHHAELWGLPDGGHDLRVVSRFEATQAAEAKRLGRPVADKRPHPAAKLLLRLHINDMIALGCGEQRRIVRVVKMSGSQLVLAAPHEGGSLKKRDAEKADPFKYINASKRSLLEERARKIFVDPSGKLFDPGPLW